ncbi:MAG: hypothetical protein AB8B55_06575 [Mariniblastus sp.]
MFKSNINRLLLAVVLLNSCALIGCHRGYYRRQADVEARRLIREKASDPRWDTADGSIEVDPQSRMFNPFSQDHPPIPPDDAASHQFMHRVNGKEGYPHWHANGDTNFVESPEWQSYLPTNEKGQVVLNLERAYQLALIHSPQLQQQRETLYSSAIEVSLQRFGFDSQLFTGFNSFLTTQGRLRGGTGVSRTTLQNQIGSNGGGLNLRKAGITGANFAVGLANTILFSFAGNNTQSANSLIDFSIIQPLLRGAGRERILEALTQSERTLLANVRQLERFRRGFYLQIAIGRNPGAGPNLGGNFLGNPGSASSNAGGYFGLLEAQQRIRNQEFNVRQLEGVLEQFREFFRRERLDAVSLKLFETSVYREQRSLLASKTAYQTSLDNFKLTLGLPPELDVVIDDTYLDRFELISDQINQQLISISVLREKTGDALNSITLLYDKMNEEDYEWPKSVSKEIESLEPFLQKAEEALETITTEDRKQLEADFRKLEAKREGRLAYLAKLQAAIESGEIISEIDADLVEAESVVEADVLRKRLEDPEIDSLEFIMVDGKEEPPQYSILKRAGDLENSLKNIREKVRSFSKTENEYLKIERLNALDVDEDGKLTREELRNLSQSEFIMADSDMNGAIAGQELDNLLSRELLGYIKAEFFERIPGQLTEMNNLILELSLLQALARSNSIEVSDIDIDSQQAIEVARCMRRDWMNARASLVDDWRNIEFVADQLEAQVDIVFEGDIGNTGDNPFKLRYETGQLRAGFRFDAPIVRVAERNQYRRALIQYQQTRRQFYQFEDNIKSNIRNILRNVEQNKVLFELDRRTVQTQIENVEINRYELDAPVAIGATGSRLGANTARNLTDAINNLNGAQNSFLRSWVQLEVLRRNLDFDMGTMQLDEMGEWMDPGLIDSSIGIRTASMLGIELDCQFCQEVGVSYETNDSTDGISSQGQPTSASPYNSGGEAPGRVPLENDEIESIMDSAPPSPEGRSLQLNSPDSSSLLRSRSLSPSAMKRSASKKRQQLSSKKSESKVNRALAGSLKSIDSFKSVTIEKKPIEVKQELVSKPVFEKPIEKIPRIEQPVLTPDFESTIVQIAEKAIQKAIQKNGLTSNSAADSSTSTASNSAKVDEATPTEPSKIALDVKRILPFRIVEPEPIPFEIPSGTDAVSRISNGFAGSRTVLASGLVEEAHTENVVVSNASPTTKLMPVTESTVKLSPIGPTNLPAHKQPAIAYQPTTVLTTPPPRQRTSESKTKTLRATATKDTARLYAVEKYHAEKAAKYHAEKAAATASQSPSAWEPPKTSVAVSAKQEDADDSVLVDLETTAPFGHTLNSQHEAFKWKKQSSSLNGVLQRFGAPNEK